MVVKRFSALVALLFGLFLLASSPAIAQDDAGIALPLAPDPARCTIAPRPLAEVRAIWEAANATPTVPSTPPADLSGMPADDATVAAVTEVIVTVLACAANGNDGLRDAAMLTDEHLRDNVIGLTQDDFDAWYTESPVASDPEHWITLYALHDVRVLADGRVAVNPDVIVPGVGQFIDTLILKQVDGVWLIDFSLEGEGNLYPVTAEMVATPTA